MYKRTVDDTWSFRSVNTKEFTHCYHAYPAMMIPQIARRLIDEMMPDGGCKMLFDPYCGSGTSLVEASLSGIDCIGTDINPLARLMSRVKTSGFDVDVMSDLASGLGLMSMEYSEDAVRDSDFSRISNYGYWYSEAVLMKLAYIEQRIADLNCADDERDFFRVALSEVVREVSFTRNGEFKRFRMADDKVKAFDPNVFGLFLSKVDRNLRGLGDYMLRRNGSSVMVCDFNTVGGIANGVFGAEGVDMVVTSPPYGDSKTTVAYGQFSRWANEWFGFADAAKLDSLLMGGKKVKEELFKTESIRDVLDEIRALDEKRYWEVVSFLNDYYLSMRSVGGVVRRGGRVCYVVGNRTVKGVQIPLDYFTAEMFEGCGFRHDDTIVRNIPSKRMPSKTSPTNVAGAKVGTMTSEYIVVMTKL